MDIYHIWCNLKPGISDLEFTDALSSYLNWLKQKGSVDNYRITRKKLSLAPTWLGEFHIMLEFSSMSKLDDAFTSVSTRNDPVESLHAAVNSKVTDFSSALYREFPDPHRHQGEEKF